jgi:Leucine-rich repeat (LRR) protein
MLREMPGFDDLTALQNLWISGNSQLEELPGLRKCVNLKLLRIGRNGELQALPGIDGLDRLEVVGFEAQDMNTTIEALKGLPATITIEARYYDIGGFTKQLNAVRSELGQQPVKVVKWRSTNWD